MAKRRIVGGGFQDSLGNPLNLGYLTFRLNTDATTGVVQVTAGIIVTVELDASGDVADIVSLWPNDQLTPTNTVYVVTAYTARGQIVWKGEIQIPSGSTPYPLQGGTTNYLLQESSPLILQEDSFGILIT